MLLKKSFRGIIKAFAVFAFIAYIAGLIYFLFFSENYGRADSLDYYRYNLEPFKEIIRFWRYREVIGIRMTVINLLGNVIMFMPFGFLLAVIYRPFRRWYALLPFGIAFSTCIECIQLMTRVGTFDVDDIILNVFGVMLGLAVYALAAVIGRRFGNEKKREEIC